MDIVEHSKYQLGYNRESSPTFAPEIAKWSVNIDILAGKDYPGQPTLHSRNFIKITDLRPLTVRFNLSICSINC